jgi:hypothetical protein
MPEGAEIFPLHLCDGLLIEALRLFLTRHPYLD